LKAKIQKDYEINENNRRIEAAKTENLLNTSKLESNMTSYVNSPYKTSTQLL